MAKLMRYENPRMLLGPGVLSRILHVYLAHADHECYPPGTGNMFLLPSGRQDTAQAGSMRGRIRRGSLLPYSEREAA